MESHRDQVLELPPTAQLLASSAHTPIEMYRIGSNILCLQGHPEFYESYLLELINNRTKDGNISHEVSKPAIESVGMFPVYKEKFRTLIHKFVNTEESIFDPKLYLQYSLSLKEILAKSSVNGCNGTIINKKRKRKEPTTQDESEETPKESPA